MKWFKILLAASGLLAVVMAAVFPLCWKVSNYGSIRRMIQAGNEAGAVDRVRELSGNRFFDINWTSSQALPQWQWVRDLDGKIFGCTSCRGNWVPLLHYAARQGHLKLVSIMLTNGATVNFYDDRGFQALASAVSGGNTNIIAMLIERGADVNATNDLGRTMNIAAGFCRDTNVLGFLIRAGAELNAPDNRGWTALDWASVWNQGALPFLEAAGGRPGTNRRINLPLTR